MIRRIEQTNITPSPENKEDKVVRLLEKIKNDPFHQQGPTVNKLHFRWVYIHHYLRNMDKEDNFNILMQSRHLTQIEKDFLLFNMHRLNELKHYACDQFKKEVEKFQNQEE